MNWITGVKFTAGAMMGIGSLPPCPDQLWGRLLFLTYQARKK
jgi:hypothetical protein